METAGGEAWRRSRDGAIGFGVNETPDLPETPSSRTRGLVSQLLKVGVSGAALWFVGRNIDFPSMRRVLAATDPTPVATVMGIYLVGQALTAWRWRLIASRVGFSRSMGDFLRYYFIGMFFNLFGPSTLGGDVVRSLYLGAAEGRRVVAFHTVFFDRLSGLVMLVFVAVAAIAVFGTFGLPWPIVATATVTGLGMGFGWFLLPAIARRVFSRTGRINRMVEQELGPFWRDRQLLVRTAGISAGFHVLQILSLILLGHALSMHVDWRYYFIFHPLVTVLSALPLSLAGLGIREAGYVWFLERQGVADDTAFAFGLLWFAVLLVSSMVGGLVYAWGGAGVPPLRATPKADRPTDSGKD
jgi:uncharacterized membrane protein YbhN (UPF0104 family)